MANRPGMQRAIGLLLVTALLLIVAAHPARAEERLKIWGTPPKEKPHFTKAGESFPPLPLPVVPQRRTEKKRPPAAPKLIANLKHFSFKGWQGSPGAVDTLLHSARRKLDVWYGWEQANIDHIVRKHQADTEHRTPILYLCSYYPLNLTADQRQALQSYVLNGGTLLINCCGQDKAFASAKAELERMFPKHPLRKLPLDHPIYHSYFEIKQVGYPTPSPDATVEGPVVHDRPRLRGIELGTRAAVIVSYEDLACGWNKWNNPTVKRVDPTDSTRLGLNIITYVTAEQRFADYLTHTRKVSGPSLRPRQQLVFVQVIHDGNWNPNPSAVPLLLKDVASNTSAAVQFQRRTMELRNPDLFNYPLVYMTGTFDPQLSRAERAVLHRYLTNGGVLLADAAAGRNAFDQAFRELCKQMFPDKSLEPLPEDHALYKAFHQIEQVAVNHEPGERQPRIEAIMLNDRPAVLYSPLGLSDGWSRQFSAYARCYEARDALKLGTNLVVYAMQ